MDSHGKPVAPQKPLGLAIPLTAVASHGSDGPDAEPEPCTGSVSSRRSSWRRTTDDGDALELEYARKKLGLCTPTPGSKKKGLLGWLGCHKGSPS